MVQTRQAELVSTMNRTLPRSIQRYLRQDGEHKFWTADVAKVSSILRKYLLESVSEEGMRSVFTVDMSEVPAEVQALPEVVEAVEHVEFRENWVREVIDILTQLSGTVPVNRVGVDYR